MVTEGRAYVAAQIAPFSYPTLLLTRQVIIVLLILLRSTAVFITLGKIQKISCRVVSLVVEALRTMNSPTGVVRSDSSIIRSMYFEDKALHYVSLLQK